MKFIHLFFLLSVLVLPNLSYSNSSVLAKAFGEFKVGDYVKTLKLLKNVQGNKKILGAKYYLEGLSLNRLQKYDEAESKFKSSLAIGHKADDLYYEFGQSLYANNNLEEARKIFNKSAIRGYKRNTSYYYVAHISQILEDWKLAKTYYLKITKGQGVDSNTMQIAQFQLGEVLLSMAEIKKNKSKTLVSKYVVPQFNKAIKKDRNSLLAKEIIERKAEVQKLYDLDPNLYKNGKVIPQKKWEFSYSQEFRYDNNITLARSCCQNCWWLA